MTEQQVLSITDGILAAAAEWVAAARDMNALISKARSEGRDITEDEINTLLADAHSAVDELRTRIAA